MARSLEARSATVRDRRRFAVICPASCASARTLSIDDCGKPHGTFGFVSEDNLQETLQELGFIGLSSKGYELEYHLEDNGGSQTLFATAASGAEGGYERTVFTLEVFSDGKYEFKLFDQIDHDPPHDFFTDGVSAFPGHDQNFDLQDTVDGDVSKLNFGGLIQFSDYDHDTVGLDGVFEVKVRDDVPEVKWDPICLTVDEDDIVTDQSLGNHPKDGDGDGSSTAARSTRSMTARRPWSASSAVSLASLSPAPMNR